MPLLLGAIFGLKESLDRFIADEEGEREQARKDRAAMRAAFGSLLALAEQQVKLLNDMKSSRGKIVIARRGDEEKDEQPETSPAQSIAPHPAPALSPSPSPSPAAPPVSPPTPTMTLADALPEGPALAAFFARELQDTKPDIAEAREEPSPPSPPLDADEEVGYRPPPRRSSIPQMIRPAAKPQEGDGPPPATLAAALARIVEDAAHEAETRADDHPPLVLTEADIVEDAPPRPNPSSPGAGPNKSAAEMSPQEIESLIASTLNQISGMGNR
jgi:hypothetical protein